jgi:hypothetical protein
MEYVLWVTNKSGKIVHLQRYQSLKEAEQELHQQNSYAGGEGRLFKIYGIPPQGRSELVQRISTI